MRTTVACRASSGLAPWGAVLTFFPLLARERGIPPAEIGLVLGVQAFVNTMGRVPTGWLLDRTRVRRPYVLGGLLAMALATAVLPFLDGQLELLLLAAVFGTDTQGIERVGRRASSSVRTRPSR